MLQDRRRRRAHSPLLATEHFLDAERERVEATVVALFDGAQIVAQSAKSPLDMRLFTPLLQETLNGNGPAANATPRDVYLHPIRVAGQNLVLASLDARVRSVREVSRSIERIFAG